MPSDRDVYLLCGFAFVVALALIGIGLLLDPPRILLGR
jgi:hypothetical protein